MGSICHIYMNPAHWNAYLTSKRLKAAFGGESLYNVRYGVIDDDPDGTTDLEMLMRESVYQKVLSGEYTVSPMSRHRHTLLLEDKAGIQVPPLASICY